MEHKWKTCPVCKKSFIDDSKSGLRKYCNVKCRSKTGFYVKQNKDGVTFGRKGGITGVIVFGKKGANSTKCNT